MSKRTRRAARVRLKMVPTVDLEGVTAYLFTPYHMQLRYKSVLVDYWPTTRRTYVREGRVGLPGYAETAVVLARLIKAGVTKEESPYAD